MAVIIDNKAERKRAVFDIKDFVKDAEGSLLQAANIANNQDRRAYSDLINILGNIDYLLKIINEEEEELLK